ncbi:hypothetical protein F4777DRAFT_363588 [Nemania sp. FL0916]|nr:hypothetical protein F4777DRAFT_363588 [Nemania sp. FL0916]
MIVPAMQTRHYHPDCCSEQSYREIDQARATRIGNEREPTSLPPIREAFPDFFPQGDEIATTPSSATSISPSGVRFPGPVTPPEYTTSPNGHKRRRLSFESEAREPNRTSQVPRPYAGLSQAGSRSHSPFPRVQSLVSPRDLEPSRSRGDGTIFSPSGLPPSANAHDRAPQRMLPSLPIPHFGPAGRENGRIHSHGRDDYMATPSGSPRMVLGHGYNGYGNVPDHGYQMAPYGYPYHHPSRAQSLSIGSVHLDQPPYHPEAYGSHFQERYIGEMGMAASGDGRPRRRRGNLPKETTDKLRSWFVGHLSHPYPTEDEKQELMRQTGLQMNQISNWFINARRRHLPTMINNARAETDVMNNRGGDKTSLSPEEPIDYDDESKGHSDSEGSRFADHDIEDAKPLKRSLKRGSV